uniref:ShKT domain-containing protein n=1 Tax=Globodera pallida TaxID=36090 RepID=A0A183CSQ4_GLOPA
WVHALLRTLPGSGLAMRLSLVAGASVCITVSASAANCWTWSRWTPNDCRRRTCTTTCMISSWQKRSMLCWTPTTN